MGVTVAFEAGKNVQPRPAMNLESGGIIKFVYVDFKSDSTASATYTFTSTDLDTMGLAAVYGAFLAHVENSADVAAIAALGVNQVHIDFPASTARHVGVYVIGPKK